jgi:hypothetical protein
MFGAYVIKQYERAVVFKLGKVKGQAREPGLMLRVPRNLQTLVEIAVDKNSTVVFPAPLMSTIGELGAFLARETNGAAELPARPAPQTLSSNGTPVASSGPPRNGALPDGGSA